jgi:hypothetical protein
VLLCSLTISSSSCCIASKTEQVLQKQLMTDASGGVDYRKIVPLLAYQASPQGGRLGGTSNLTKICAKPAYAKPQDPHSSIKTENRQPDWRRVALRLVRTVVTAWGTKIVGFRADLSHWTEARAMLETEFGRQRVHASVGKRLGHKGHACPTGQNPR